MERKKQSKAPNQPTKVIWKSKRTKL